MFNYENMSRKEYQQKYYETHKSDKEYTCCYCNKTIKLTSKSNHINSQQHRKNEMNDPEIKQKYEEAQRKRKEKDEYMYNLCQKFKDFQLTKEDKQFIKENCIAFINKALLTDYKKESDWLDGNGVRVTFKDL